MTKEGFKLFLQKDDKKDGTCSNSRISGQDAGSGYHPAKTLFKWCWGYLCVWILSEHQAPLVPRLVKTGT